MRPNTLLLNTNEWKLRICGVLLSVDSVGSDVSLYTALPYTAFFSIVEVGGFAFLEARSVAATQRRVIQWVLRGRSKVKKGAMMATLVSELNNQNSMHNIFLNVGYSFMCISLHAI